MSETPTRTPRGPLNRKIEESAKLLEAANRTAHGQAAEEKAQEAINQIAGILMTGGFSAATQQAISEQLNKLASAVRAAGKLEAAEENERLREVLQKYVDNCTLCDGRGEFYSRWPFGMKPCPVCAEARAALERKGESQ